MVQKSLLLNSEGDAEKSYQVLAELRKKIEFNEEAAKPAMSSLIYLQGVTALRRGENDNCVNCRGESSCILPIAPSAIHVNPTGSRAAIKHFTEFLDRVPRRPGGSLALEPGTHDPGRVSGPGRSPFPARPERVSSTPSSTSAGFAISATWWGSIALTRLAERSWRTLTTMGCWTSRSARLMPLNPCRFTATRGMRPSRTAPNSAGVTEQLGGLVCYQTDYNNDGRMDIYIARGAWVPMPIRPTLLRNDGASGFTDVTRESGLLDPVNSNAAAWADYDNDGWLDLFVGCEKQTNRLFHNRGDGTFEEVAASAGVQEDEKHFCKGCAWIDYDNDGYPDLFLNNLARSGRLYHNNRDGSFTDISTSMGIDGPYAGFSCWAWDYDNDGWLDIFATCYDRSLADVVKGLIGQPHGRYSNRLFRNLQGQGFQNVTERSGIEHGLLHDGEQLRRFRQRRLARHVSGHRRAQPGHAGAQPHVQERRRHAILRDHRVFRHGPPAKGAWRGMRRLGPRRRRRCIRRRPAAPSTATNTTTSSSRTPARGTTG